jgi:hypothetical protein
MALISTNQNYKFRLSFSLFSCFDFDNIDMNIVLSEYQKTADDIGISKIGITRPLGSRS